jgi:hypothetical protein
MSDRQSQWFYKALAILLKATSFCDTRVSEDIHHEIEIIKDKQGRKVHRT